MTPLRQRIIDDLSVREHQEVLSQRHDRTHPPLSTQPGPHRGPGNLRLPSLPARETRFGLEDLQHRSPRGALLLSHHHGAARPPLVRARCQAAFQAARNHQPRRTGAPVHRRNQPQAPSLAPDGLCRRAASPANSVVSGFPTSIPGAWPCVSNKSRAARIATCRSRPGSWRTCAPTGAEYGLDPGCSRVAPPTDP